MPSDTNERALAEETGTTVVSAPGKVLLAGGYVVLDRAYTGLVISTSSRFYTCVRPLRPLPSAPAPASDHHSSGADSPIITIRAGQFPAPQSTWIYSVDLGLGGPQVEVRQTNAAQAGPNKFVHLTLEAVVRYAAEVLEVSHGTSDERGAAGAAGGGGGGGGGARSELARKLGRGLDVSVWADNDFYSQREQASFSPRLILVMALAAQNLPLLRSSLSSLAPFCPLPRPIPQTNKTGLGSSAALVTSLVAGLLQHLGLVALPDIHASLPLHDPSAPPEPSFSSPSGSHFHPGPVPKAVSTTAPPSDLDKIHSLAQYAHCLAQGKVGSGFDVSSATYGSHIYRRFSPAILAPLLSSSSSASATPSTPSTSPRLPLLPHLDPAHWDAQITPFRLPRGVRLLLADVDAGTDTPSFVGQVLKWRTDNPALAKEVWDGLDRANVKLGQELSALRDLEAEEGYTDALLRAAQLDLASPSNAQPTSHNPVSSTNDRVLSTLSAISATLGAIRALMRRMSDLSGVPIEPPAQTRLLDACSALPGVLGGGVPGAGGFDAVFLLVVDVGDPSAHPQGETGAEAREVEGEEEEESEVVRRVGEVWADWKEMSVCPLMAAESEGGGGLRKESLGTVNRLKEALDKLSER